MKRLFSIFASKISMNIKKIKYIWQQTSWTHFSWDSETLLPLLAQGRLIQGKVLATAKAFGTSFTAEAQIEILTEEVIKTAAIEGETLNRDSVKSSVARHLGIADAGLPRSERHIDGLVEILLDATKKFDSELTSQRLCSWQAALFPTGYSGLHKISVGAWRKGDIYVVSQAHGREKIHFQAPPSKKLTQEIKSFLEWWEKSLGKVEGLLRAGIAHFWFVTIHPFDDGNGRIARALTDMALAQDEKSPIRMYSLSSQIMEERKAYYDILEKSQKGNGDITPWLSWFLGCLIRSIE